MLRIKLVSVDKKSSLINGNQHKSWLKVGLIKKDNKKSKKTCSEFKKLKWLKLTKLGKENKINC